MLQRYKKMFNYQRLMFNAPITPIQNSEFKILLSEGSAKDERRMSEGWAKNKSLCGSHRAGAAEYVTKDERRIINFSRHYSLKNNRQSLTINNYFCTFAENK